jgi:hypothetical protein
MSGLKIKIDTQSLAKQLKDIAIDAERDLRKGVADLAAITHAKVAEMASQELHSSRKKFMDNLGFEEITDGVWVVSVDEGALWIEEGIEPNTDMKPGLLKGRQSRVIPFDHGKAPSQLNGYAQNIVSRIRANLKKEGVPFKGIEKGANGAPLTGKLHTFPKEGATQEEKKRWSGEIPGKGNTPVLKGVSIYQTLTKTGNVRRDILTFRTVSGGPTSSGKWIHPGMEPKKFLDKAAEWALQEWETKILPEIMGKYGK